MPILSVFSEEKKLSIAALSRVAGPVHGTGDAVISHQPREPLARNNGCPACPSVCQAAIRVAWISLRRCEMSVKASLARVTLQGANATAGNSSIGAERADASKDITS